MAEKGRAGTGILPEAGEPDEVQAVLSDVQDVMALPWRPFPWAAYASQPPVLRLFWARLRTFTGTDLFLRESLAISGSVQLGISSWYRPNAGTRFAQATNQPLSLAWELDAFEFGLPQLLIQQVALAHALRGEEVGREGRAIPRSRPGPFQGRELEFPAWDDLAPEALSTARQMRQAWSLPQGVPEVLVLAKWPRFLNRSWKDVQAWRMRPEYQSLRRRVSDMAEDAMDRLRPHMEIGQDELRSVLMDAAAWTESLDRLKDQVSSFTLILPGMILDNALLRVAAAAWKDTAAQATT